MLKYIPVYIYIDNSFDESTNARHHECERSNWPAYYFFGGSCRNSRGYLCPYQTAAEQLFEKIPNHVIRMEDDNIRNIKSNAKMMYIRVDNHDLSSSYVRYDNLEQEFEFDDDDWKTTRPVEHILTLDVASNKVTFSIKKMNKKDADTENIKHPHQYEYSHAYFDIDSQYIYIPFVEGSDDYNITFHDS